jgi:peptidoglycan/LPS O-acetylase OafA/YrhL
MIEIAGGIILAVFILALLPWIFVGLSWAFALAVVLALAGGAVWLVWTGAQSTEGLAVEFIIGGVFLIWLHYEIKARREMKAELDATPAAGSNPPAPQSTGHREPSQHRGR